VYAYTDIIIEGPPGIILEAAGNLFSLVGSTIDANSAFTFDQPALPLPPSPNNASNVALTFNSITITIPGLYRINWNFYVLNPFTGEEETPGTVAAAVSITGGTTDVIGSVFGISQGTLNVTLQVNGGVLVNLVAGSVVQLFNRSVDSDNNPIPITTVSVQSSNPNVPNPFNNTINSYLTVVRVAP
jgi:hypothetical protein